MFKSPFLIVVGFTTYVDLFWPFEYTFAYSTSSVPYILNTLNTYLFHLYILNVDFDRGPPYIFGERKLNRGATPFKKKFLHTYI